jgi:hypothetical protein
MKKIILKTVPDLEAKTPENSVTDARIMASDLSVCIYDEKNNVKHYVSLLNGKVITRPLNSMGWD